MLLSELYNQLSLGELSNLSMGNNGSGEVKPTAKPAIVMHANEALLRLHSKFILKEKNLILGLLDHISTYKLQQAYTVSAGAEGNSRYILDTVDDPFTGDIVRILEAQDSSGVDLNLNNDSDPLSLYTPQSEIIQVPNPKAGRAISLSYQAYHAELVHDDNADPEIEIPELLEGALKAYIGYKIFSNMQTQAAVARANDLRGLYEFTCNEVIEKDLISESRSAVTNKFHENGWI